MTQGQTPKQNNCRPRGAFKLGRLKIMIERRAHRAQLKLVRILVSYPIYSARSTPTNLHLKLPPVPPDLKMRPRKKQLWLGRARVRGSAAPTNLMNETTEKM